MADGGPPAPPAPPQVTPPVQPPIPPIQLIVPPAQPIPIPTQPIQPAYVPQLNQLHFKPEFAGKPDKDVEAHLLRMNDWLNTHVFPEGVKVQCLWYESLRPINIDWIGL